MKNTTIVLFLVFYFCSITTTICCSCLSLPKTFCSLVDTEHTLLTGKVLRHYEKISLNDFPVYTFMDIQVTEQINGENIQSTITIIGEDGTSCGINLRAYQIGANWLFKLRRRDRDQINVEGLEHHLYRMSPCNISALPIENEVIMGLVAPGVEKVTVANFKDSLDECFLIIDEKERKDGIAFKVQPTLVKTRVEVTKGIIHFGVKVQDIQVRLINVNGQLIEEHNLPGTETYFEIDMTYYAKGIYFLVFYTGNTIITEKIVKA